VAILVTGGLGYIGSHLVDSLSKTEDVYVLDVNNGFIEGTANKHINFIECDIRNKSDLQNIFQRFDFKLVYHLAALKSIANSVLNENLFLETNVRGLRNLLEVIPKKTSLIFASSAAVYKPNEFSPLVETDNLDPISIYGKTKLNGERLIFNLKSNAIILRLFNVAGKRIGVKYISNEINIFPTFTNFLKNEKALPIYGTNFPTPDGSAIRDFVHIEDVVSALVASARIVSDETVLTPRVFNIATGVGTSIFEIIRLLEIETGTAPRTELFESRDGELSWSIGNSAKFQSATGWTLKYDVSSIVSSEWAFRNFH
jgi:UDP-glucose 4-epimerase